MDDLTQSEKNTRRLGTFVQEAMEGLERDFPEGEVGTIGIVIEIQNEREDGTPSTTTRFICTDARNFVQMGLLRSAMLAAEER